jgi:hypothetical protein
MADFLTAYRIVKENEGGYNDSLNDPGNFCDGVFVGTNRGISAPTMADTLLGGRCPTISEMKALTSKQAQSVLKTKFWDRIRGDDIENQNIAIMLFDTIVNQTGYFNSIVLWAVTKQRSYYSGFALPFDDNEIKTINSLDQRKFFNDLKTAREEKYRYEASKSASQATNLPGWLNRLKKLNWNEAWQMPITFGAIALLVIAIGIGVGFYVVNHKKLKKLL